MSVVRWETDKRMPGAGALTSLFRSKEAECETSPPCEVDSELTPLDRSSTRADNRYFLGIDGGGTKTHAVITDGEGRVLGEGFSGASNPVRVGVDEAVYHISSAVSAATARSGIELDRIRAACVALAGINHPIFETMRQALGRALGIGAVQFVTDAHAALAGALDGRPGVVVIAGTGSIALGVNQRGEQARSGGWGPTLGDEGSGYDIARRALRAVAASFDGRSPLTDLAERICRRLGVTTPADLPGVIYSADSQPAQIAPLAELVAEAAADGDEVARSILAQAGAELGRLVVSVIDRLNMAQDDFRVACVGGVFKSGELILAGLREAVLSVAPGAKLSSPLFAPAIGAARLARASEAEYDRRATARDKA